MRTGERSWSSWRSQPVIPDTPENVARAILTMPPKKKGRWHYLKERIKKKGGKER